MSSGKGKLLYLTEAEIDRLRASVQTIRKDTAASYSRLSRRERIIGVGIMARDLLNAAMVSLQEEDTFESEEMAAVVRSELQRVLVRVFQEEFGVELPQELSP